MEGQQIELIIFCLVSLVILYSSKDSLRDRHSYGYYRFFALEFTLLSVITNLALWFHDPLSALQIVSWILLFVASYLVISGFSALGFSRAAGKLDSYELVESGIYSLVRHPIYSSLLFVASGSFFKSPSLFSAILVFGSFFTTITAATTEEKVNVVKFGKRYEDYIRRTKMFVPYII